MSAHSKLMWMGTALALLSSPSLQADTLRCGTQIISTGDRAFEVERKCGQPAYRDLISAPTDSYYGQAAGPIIEEWVYGPSNGVFNILRFEGNRLVHIEIKREY